MNRMLRRTAYAVNLAAFMVALATIAVVVNYFAHRTDLRMRVDATKTRAYSLSDQTLRLLDGLTGDWTIALIMVADDADAATRAQVDEVLKRYQQAQPAISVVRVDPTDPSTLGEYEALLARLREHERDRIAAYERAIAEGVVAFDELRVFAQQQAGQLERILEMLDPADPGRGDIQRRLGPMSVIGGEGQAVLDRVREARQVNEGQPIPDYETARSILGHVTSEWANELDEMARIYVRWRERADVPPAVARFSASVVGDYQTLAQRLAIVADPLASLPPLELASIGRQLAGGEAAVVIGPKRTAVVPSEQLFPSVNRRKIGADTVAFDRRFRGEQVISAAIRSLLVDEMPLVVFMHNEPRSLMRDTPQHDDVLGVADMLHASRFEVTEWSVGHTDRPIPHEGQPVVWIVVPPSAREELEPDRAERLLIRGVEQLIADGESVMLNLYPSLLPRYRRPDPWPLLAAPLGLRVATGTPIFESLPDPDGTPQYQQGITVARFPDGNPVSAAVHGQQTYFVLPVPVEPVDPVPGGVRQTVLAAVDPSPVRWLEADWARKLAVRTADEPGTPFENAQPIAVAAERSRSGEDGGEQRMIVIGSGGWMLSYVADVYATIGGQRAALTNPGNHEFMLASVAWLAGMDELIAPSPVSRQVARLDGLDVPTRVRWGLLAIVGAPLGCLLVGMLVFVVRRV
ncbi:MAG: hypothetical protein GY715_05900 [Planctomycetes bacterium]|nr:hypothetical protein [Planctomycetota bacterium]